MSTIISVSLVTIVCPDCAGVYAISESYQEEARDKGNFLKCWTCPYCQISRGFGESRHEKEVARLKAEAARIANEKQMAEQRASLAIERMVLANVERHKAERKLKRANSGVCTCCNRTMATKHEGKPFAPPKLSATEKAKAKGYKTT